MPGIRLGTELAKRAAFWGRVGGIFHSDELPGYGITENDVEAIYHKLECGPTDAFVLVADARENALDGLRAIVERAREAVEGVPEETRAANPDGTTHYMRPRPGAARMYPETDVAPVAIERERMRSIAEHLPRMPAEVAGELQVEYRVSPKLASQVVDSEFLSVFEKIAGASNEVSPIYVATVLTWSL